MKTTMKLTVDSLSVNEGFVRVAVAAFIARLDPTIEELNDIKTAVSEAVTNAIVHAYPETVGKIHITAAVEENTVRIAVRDTGKGIADIKQAMQPLFSTGGEERAGLGFAVMESFCDRLTVRSKPGKGTTVTLFKVIRSRYAAR